MNKKYELPFSKTVYSWVMPETERLVDKILAEDEMRDELRYRHRKAWTKRQDDYHEEFFQQWRWWVEDVVETEDVSFRHAYPTAGSSEAIRESLAQHAATGHSLPMVQPRIHVFKGEYEGYKALAEGYNIEVLEHDRSGNWRETISDWSKGGDLFYLSQPSSLDGNYWHDFDEFMDLLANTDTKLMLDLCYVGCMPAEAYPDKKINMAHEVIDSVFFSLSKTFGLYYWRVGGMLTKTEHPGLWGNKWFKNLTALKLGTEFMKKYHVTELPDKYQPLKEEVLEEQMELMEKMDVQNVESSDVYLLANAEFDGDWNLYQRYDDQARICLTPALYEKAQQKGLYEYNDAMDKR